MSDDTFDATLELADAEGHLFIPSSAAEREIDDDVDGHVNHRPLDKGND